MRVRKGSRRERMRPSDEPVSGFWQRDGAGIDCFACAPFPQASCGPVLGRRPEGLARRPLRKAEMRSPALAVAGACGRWSARWPSARSPANDSIERPADGSVQANGFVFWRATWPWRIRWHSAVDASSRHGDHRPVWRALRRWSGSSGPLVRGGPWYPPPPVATAPGWPARRCVAEGRSSAAMHLIRPGKPQNAFAESLGGECPDSCPEALAQDFTGTGRIGSDWRRRRTLNTILLKIACRTEVGKTGTIMPRALPATFAEELDEDVQERPIDPAVSGRHGAGRTRGMAGPRRIAPSHVAIVCPLPGKRHARAP